MHIKNSCTFVKQNNGKYKIMKTIALENKTEYGFEGRTLESFLNGIDYIKECLQNKMENWERKEYESVLKDYEDKVCIILEIENINEYYNL